MAAAQLIEIAPSSAEAYVQEQLENTLTLSNGFFRNNIGRLSYFTTLSEDVPTSRIYQLAFGYMEAAAGSRVWLLAYLKERLANHHDVLVMEDLFSLPTDPGLSKRPLPIVEFDGRDVYVVVDSQRASRGGLEWALRSVGGASSWIGTLVSHADFLVRDHDMEIDAGIMALAVKTAHEMFLSAYDGDGLLIMRLNDRPSG